MGGGHDEMGVCEKNDEKSRNLTQNYANSDKLGGFRNILGSQKIIFIKWGGHNKMILVVKNEFPENTPLLQLGTREYPKESLQTNTQFRIS